MIDEEHFTVFLTNKQNSGSLIIQIQVVTVHSFSGLLLFFLLFFSLLNIIIFIKFFFGARVVSTGTMLRCSVRPSVVRRRRCKYVPGQPTVNKISQPSSPNFLSQRLSICPGAGPTPIHSWAKSPPCPLAHIILSRSGYPTSKSLRGSHLIT